MKIYDEYTSKIKSASSMNSLKRFVERLCAKMGIRSISDTALTAILTEEREDVLSALREETQYVVLLMREVVEKKQVERADIEKDTNDMNESLIAGIQEVEA